MLKPNNINVLEIFRKRIHFFPTRKDSALNHFANAFDEREKGTGYSHSPTMFIKTSSLQASASRWRIPLRTFSF
ncbi:hypothetical protein O5623_07525 [Escherichia coli]|nr:hypothetical protein [Escherichia coli]